MKVRSFKQLNHLVKVTYRKKITCPEKGALMGDCDPDMGKIQVSLIAPASGQYAPPEILEHNRWHEQVHYMFQLLNRGDLYEDETLVDNLAGLLAQYEATAKRR
jgi:hypothetical protein